MAKAVFFPHSRFRHDPTTQNPRQTLFLAEGGYDKNYLMSFRMHDAISSVRVPGNFRVTLFRDDKWRGQSVVLQSDAESLGQFNDRTSSIVVEDTTVSDSLKARLHRDTDLQSSYISVGPGQYDIGDISVGNDAISSARVPPSVLVVLFQNSGFSGRVLALDRSAPNFNAKDFNDRASSIVVYDQASFEGRLAASQASARQIGDHPRISGFDDPAKQLVETDSVLIGEALVPLQYIDDSEFADSTRALEFPFYILRREQFWKKLYSFDTPGTLDFTDEQSYQVGVIRKESTSTETTESISVTIGAELSIPIVKGLAPTLKGTIERKLQTTVVQVSETTNSEAVERTVTRSFVVGPRLYLAGWAIVDRYSVVRIGPGNSRTSLSVWEAIVPDQISEDSFVA